MDNCRIITSMVGDACYISEKCKIKNKDNFETYVLVSNITTQNMHRL